MSVYLYPVSCIPADDPNFELLTQSFESLLPQRPDLKRLVHVGGRGLIVRGEVDRFGQILWPLDYRPEDAYWEVGVDVIGEEDIFDTVAVYGVVGNLGQHRLETSFLKAGGTVYKRVYRLPFGCTIATSDGDTLILFRPRIWRGLDGYDHWAAGSVSIPKNAALRLCHRERSEADDPAETQQPGDHHEEDRFPLEEAKADLRLYREEKPVHSRR